MEEESERIRTHPDLLSQHIIHARTHNLDMSEKQFRDVVSFSVSLSLCLSVSLKFPFLLYLFLFSLSHSLSLYHFHFFYQTISSICFVTLWHPLHPSFRFLPFVVHSPSFFSSQRIPTPTQPSPNRSSTICWLEETPPPVC